jgi:acetyl-CoA carboxylase carboxyl transferase subunit beta
MHFDKPTYSVRRTKKKGIPEGLYTKDPVTGEIFFNKEIEDNQMVVPKSGHHFPIGARQRLSKLLDAESFVERDGEVRSHDTLNFVDTQPYADRIKRYQRDSGLAEAVISGTGSIHGIPVAIAVMDFRFCGGAMGAAAGEKITRTIEVALSKKIPCIIVSASGGARMQEGIYSLMQMAKTSSALGRLAQAGLPYISVLTNPTTGGVTASFATLGDVILAEPGAMIGFAGDQGHDEADASGRLPDRRIPPQTRARRPDRSPHGDARPHPGYSRGAVPEERVGRRGQLDSGR